MSGTPELRPFSKGRPGGRRPCLFSKGRATSSTSQVPVSSAVQQSHRTAEGGLAKGRKCKQSDSALKACFESPHVMPDALKINKNASKKSTGVSVPVTGSPEVPVNSGSGVQTPVVTPECPRECGPASAGLVNTQNLNYVHSGGHHRRALDLFSGTGSVGEVLEKMGFEVVSLDKKPTCKPNLCIDLMFWDYQKLPLGILT